MTPEEAYEVLLRGDGKGMNDPDFRWTHVRWFFDSDTGVLCRSERPGVATPYPVYVRPASDEPDHDLAYEGAWEGALAYDPEMAEEKDEVEYPGYAPEWLSLFAVVPPFLDPGVTE